MSFKKDQEVYVVDIPGEGLPRIRKRTIYRVLNHGLSMVNGTCTVPFDMAFDNPQDAADKLETELIKYKEKLNRLLSLTDFKLKEIKNVINISTY